MPMWLATPWYKYEFWLKRLNRIRIRRFVKRCTAKGYFKGPVLDVGAGYRSNEPEIGVKPYWTLDHESKLNPKFIGDAQNMSMIPTEVVGAIVCTEVLEHLEEPLKALKECNRVLKEAGHLVLTTPFWFGIHEKPWQKDYYRYTPSGIKYLLEQAGFYVIEFETHGWRGKDRPDNIFVVARKKGNEYDGQSP